MTCWEVLTCGGVLCWCTYHDSTDSTSLWTQTGQTQQHCLLSANVCGSCTILTFNIKWTWIHQFSDLTLIYLHSTLVIITSFRWEMVTECWLEDPSQRPSFNDLVKTLFDLLDSDTSYIRLTWHILHFDSWQLILPYDKLLLFCDYYCWAP